MWRDEISKSREQNSQKKLRHFLTNSAAQHVYSLQSTRVVFQSIQWHENSLTHDANQLANDERDEACSSGAFRNLKLSDFLKKGRRRHNDEKTDRTDWFLQPFSTWNQSINAISVSINQVKTQTEVSEAETKQAFVWCFLIEHCYHHLYVLTSSITDVLETTEKSHISKRNCCLKGQKVILKTHHGSLVDLSAEWCSSPLNLLTVSPVQSVNSFLSFCSRSLPQNEANSQRETAAGTKPRLWNQTTFLSWGKTSGETPAEP